jgi:hypothetical protein
MVEMIRNMRRSWCCLISVRIVCINLKDSSKPSLLVHCQIETPLIMCHGNSLESQDCCWSDTPDYWIVSSISSTRTLVEHRSRIALNWILTSIHGRLEEALQRKFVSSEETNLRLIVMRFQRGGNVPVNPFPHARLAWTGGIRVRHNLSKEDFSREKKRSRSS